MEDKKDTKKKQREENAKKQDTTSIKPNNMAPIPDDDDNVATAEDMEAFIRDRRAKDKEKHIKDNEEKTDVFGEYYAPENSIDPYVEPDPTLPWVKYEEHLFLSRGCKKCPESYVPVSECETRSCSKVTSCNWMRGIRPPGSSVFDYVEVRFKNNRKDFFRLPDGLEVTEGDVVAVEGVPGHDIGIVSLTGEVCRIQMKKRHIEPDSESVRKLFRRAKGTDIERWVESLKNEHNALLKTRQIASDLNLDMKINDVEYQGDNAKAIFYYTADDRVDFRTLIKVLAEEFHVRIEMKQIGVRQEAGKVGGLGTCGREICCSTWLTNFKSVTTNTAKIQQILPNPQKLAGQCGKLKCCLNFECEVYADALKKFPPANTSIRFQKGLALYKKTDVLRGIMWYCYEGENELHAIPADRVKEIIEMNRSQKYPEKLEDYQVELMSTAALVQETNNSEFEKELRRMADDMTEPDNRPNDRKRERTQGEQRKSGNRQREDRPREDRQRNESDRRQQYNEQRVREEQRREDSRLRSNNNNRNARNNPRRSSDKKKRTNQ